MGKRNEMKNMEEKNDIEEKREEIKNIVNKLKSMFNYLFDEIIKEIDNFNETELNDMLAHKDEVLDEIDRWIENFMKDIKERKAKAIIEPIDIGEKWESIEKTKDFAD